MTNFPGTQIEYTEAMPSGRGQSVRANIDVSTGAGAIGQAISGLGGAISDLGLKWDLKEANTKFSKYKSDVGILGVKRDAEVFNAEDANEIKAIYARYGKSAEGLKQTLANRRAIQAADIWDNKQIPINAKSLFDARRNKTINNERTRLFEKQQEVLVDPSKLGEFEDELIRSQIIDKNNPDDIGPAFTKLEAAKMLAEARKMAVVGQITKLYSLAAAQPTEKLQAEQYDAARELTQASTLSITEKESLLNTINIVELRNKRKSIDLDYELDMKVNEDFVSRIIDNTLEPDTVENSRLDDKAPAGIFSTAKLSKQEWKQYVGETYKPPPQKTAPKGFASISRTVFDYAKFQIPKEEAYRSLLDSRYIYREINDQDFVWAINHIRNPYPRHLIADIDAVMQSNTESIAKGGFLWGFITTDAEEEKAREVNTEFIQWLDNEIAQDREPTREQMNNESAQLKAENGRDITQRPVIDTQSEYDNLKSGTEFQDAKTGEFFRKQ